MTKFETYAYNLDRGKRAELGEDNMEKPVSWVVPILVFVGVFVITTLLYMLMVCSDILVQVNHV